MDEELPYGGKVMSLMDHLDELRAVIVRSALVVIALFIVAMVFSTQIIEFLKVPLLNALPDGSSLHFTGPLDPFMATIQVSFLTSLVFGCPFWLYQFWKFLEPGLYPKERRYILPFAVSSVCLFISGILFCYYVMLPYSLAFLIDLGMEVGTPMITINDYFSLLTILMLAFGLIFETPVILILLSLLDIIDAEMLSQHRRVIIVIILIVAAVLTPPDPVSQIAMAVPMYIMYEASILIIRAIRGRSEKNVQTV